MQKYGAAALLLFSMITMGLDCTHQMKTRSQFEYKGPKNNTPETVVDPTRTIVAILTTEGEIRVQLYNETPIHRDNFLKLVESHFYDSLLFHRVIESFVIQGGDPDSKHAKDGQLLGDGDIGTIPAEFNPKFFHKRGALAAARESDLLNLNRESSGCQFYIVQGRTFTDSLLKTQGKRIVKNQVYNQVINRPENKWMVDKYVKFNKEKSDSALWYSKEIDRMVQKEVDHAPSYQFSPGQIQAYTTIGGAPHLDGSYTVFGEVIQGMDIVDKIARKPRDGNDRPLENVRILKMIVLRKI